MNEINKSKENYILKLKDEIDNLSNRRQNMFNVSIVVITAIILPIFGKVFLVENIKTINQSKILKLEGLYTIIVLMFITFCILLLSKHKYIAKIKYKVLDDLIAETGLMHYRYEYELLKDEYINNKRNLKISHIEIIILYAFSLIPMIVFQVLNIKINCKNKSLFIIYMLFIILNLIYLFMYKSKKSKY